MHVVLIFPPGWSLNVGAPHIALPLIKSYLTSNGHSATVLDLSYDFAEFSGAHVSLLQARDAVKLGSLEAFNSPYFEAEDLLNNRARSHGASWNVQLGPSYKDYNINSSDSCLAASTTDSPFTRFYGDEVLPKLSALDPDLVGFNIASRFQLVPTLELCGLIKRSASRTKIVLGGNTVSRLFDEMKLEKLFGLVDYIAKFQGEKTMLELCKFLDRKSVIQNVPNIAWFDGRSVIENYSDNSLDPNDVPTPSFDDLPTGHYWGANYLPMLGGRGCYYGKCYFCAIPYGWGANGYKGKKSDDLIYEDMKNYSSKYYITNYKFVDESLDPSTMDHLAEKIIREGFRTRWEGYTRLEKCWQNRKFVEKIAKSGFKKAYFGLELLPKSKRALMNKHDCEDPLPIIMNCFDSGIKVHLFCMLGFPGTGIDEAHETMEFVLDHQMHIDTIDVFAFGYAKHTRIEGIRPIMRQEDDWALEYGYKAVDGKSLDSESVEELARYYEEVVFGECPRLIHPIYRLFSPWVT